MRAADQITLIRTVLVFVVVYMVLFKYLAFLAVLILGIALFLDGLDGFLAVREESNGNVSLVDYLKAASGNEQLRKRMKDLKGSLAKKAPLGARIDIAGDRIAEYAMWAVFTFVHIIPLYIILSVIALHSFVDAVMGAKGTSTRMQSTLGRYVYNSNFSRMGIAVVKFIGFGYLILVYAGAYPMWIGYILLVALLAFIFSRGIAQLYDTLLYRPIAA